MLILVLRTNQNYGGKYHFQVNVNDEDTNYLCYHYKIKSNVFGQNTENTQLHHQM